MCVLNGVVVIIIKSGKGVCKGKLEVIINIGFLFDKVFIMFDF